MTLYVCFLRSRLQNVFYESRFTENVFLRAGIIEWYLTFRFSIFQLLFKKTMTVFITI